MPGPKKGSAASRGVAPLPKLAGYTKLKGKSERYSAPGGGTISKREYLTRQRAQAYFGGKRAGLEQYAALNRLIDKQVALSTNTTLTIAQKRKIAFDAASLVIKSPKSRQAQNDMFDILRNTLGYDEPHEVGMYFWYHDDEALS
jgi:hypothetical protein